MFLVYRLYGSSRRVADLRSPCSMNTQLTFKSVASARSVKVYLNRDLKEDFTEHPFSPALVFLRQSRAASTY
jgi:hypothetical protein